MPVWDCQQRQQREHTQQELTAIEAARQAEAARPPREPDGFSFTPRELLEALVAEGVMTASQALGVRNRLKR